MKKKELDRLHDADPIDHIWFTLFAQIRKGLLPRKHTQATRWRYYASRP